MISLQTILVATDFSEHSQTALHYGAALANAFQAEVVLCNILPRVDMLSQLPPLGAATFPPDFQQQQEQASLAECEKWLTEAGLTSGRAVVRTGTPFVEIVRLAEEERADLLIVGTHGRGAIAHLLLGSVAEKVVQKAPCPVLTVRSGEHEFVMP